MARGQLYFVQFEILLLEMYSLHEDLKNKMSSKFFSLFAGTLGGVFPEPWQRLLKWIKRIIVPELLCIARACKPFSESCWCIQLICLYIVNFAKYTVCGCIHIAPESCTAKRFDVRFGNIMQSKPYALR